jgi:hypothetical protein
MPPRTFWAYLAGTGALIALSFAPSRVHTTYSVSGTILELLLLGGLFAGWNLSRLILIVIGLAAGIGSLALQSDPIDVVAALWSALAVAVTCLLLTPSMRESTRRRPARREVQSLLPGAPDEAEARRGETLPPSEL